MPAVNLEGGVDGAETRVCQKSWPCEGLSKLSGSVLTSSEYETWNGCGEVVLVVLSSCPDGKASLLVISFEVALSKARCWSSEPDI